MTLEVCPIAPVGCCDIAKKLGSESPGSDLAGRELKSGTIRVLGAALKLLDRTELPAGAYVMRTARPGCSARPTRARHRREKGGGPQGGPKRPELEVKLRTCPLTSGCVPPSSHSFCQFTSLGERGPVALSSIDKQPPGERGIRR